jgi:hypothetical protein
VQRRGGPTYKTVLKAERGAAVRPALLDRHAAALGLTIPDLVREVLRGAPFTAEAARVARAYDAIDPPARQYLLGLARLFQRRAPQPR